MSYRHRRLKFLVAGLAVLLAGCGEEATPRPSTVPITLSAAYSSPGQMCTEGCSAVVELLRTDDGVVFSGATRIRAKTSPSRAFADVEFEGEIEPGVYRTRVWIRDDFGGVDKQKTALQPYCGRGEVDIAEAIRLEIEVQETFERCSLRGRAGSAPTDQAPSLRDSA